MNKLTTKVRNFFMIMMAFIMVTAMPTTAFAKTDMTVSVEGEVVNVDCFEIDGTVYLSDNDGLSEILNEMGEDNFSYLPDENGIPLEDALDGLEYSIRVSGDEVRISKGSSSDEDEDDDEEETSSSSSEEEEEEDEDEEDRHSSSDEEEDEEEDEIYEDVTIFVNDARLKKVNAFVVDDEEDIFLKSQKDVERLMEALEIDEDCFYMPNKYGILLEHIVEDFDLDFEYDDDEYEVFIESSKKSDSAEDSDTDTYKMPDLPEYSTSNSLKVYVNNMKTPNHYTDVNYLRTWASQMGYKFVQSGNRIYINSNGQTPIEVTLNGKVVDFEDQGPIVTNGRTLVPIRTISELLDCEVNWDADTKRVSAVNDKVSMALWLGNTSYWKNNEYFQTDVAPIAYNGRTMVPLRLLSEAFGCKVTYSNYGGLGHVNMSI